MDTFYERLLIRFFPNKTKRNFKSYLSNKEEIDQYIQYLEWGTHLPVIHQIKQKNIHKYKEEFHFKIFIETGTYLGDMVQAQKYNFKKLISIELSEELFHQAVLRFEMEPHVTILYGDSGKLLKEVIKDIQEPALFWLDGHYSSGITAKSEKNTPILEELKIIFNSQYKHGILIDDARLFTGRNDYPSIDQLCELVKEYAPHRTVEVADDIIRIMDKQ